MLRGKFFEINEEIKIGGQICPPPPSMNTSKKSEQIVPKFCLYKVIKILCKNINEEIIKIVLRIDFQKDKDGIIS